MNMDCSNCSRCKHFEGGYGIQKNGYILISDSSKTSYKNLYGTCNDGRNDTMKKWWNDNGHLPIDESENLPCFQATKF